MSLFFVDVTAATHWASEAIEVQGPRRYFTPAEQPEHGMGDPGGHRSTAGSARSPGRLRSPATAVS